MKLKFWPSDMAIQIVFSSLHAFLVCHERVMNATATTSSYIFVYFLRRKLA